jgi:hypothetical protein
MRSRRLQIIMLEYLFTQTAFLVSLTEAGVHEKNRNRNKRNGNIS